MSAVRILGRARHSGYLVATDDETPFLWFLTECCHASAKGVEGGVACRSCYEYIDEGLGGVYDEKFDGPIDTIDEMV